MNFAGSVASRVAPPSREWTNATAIAAVTGSGSSSMQTCGLFEDSVKTIRSLKPSGAEIDSPDLIPNRLASL
tara:strand:- start:21 stop:236 length:216 start_codon:yes stop_codon:yes gene_type:complete